MPNKYEREIEEILRNMDRTDQGQSLGDRIRAFNRPALRPNAGGPRLRLRLGASEALLVTGVALALIGAGISFYFFGVGDPAIGLYANIAGAIGVVALICFLAGLFIGWAERFGGASGPSWRGQPATKRRFNPFAPIATQFRIMRLKWRYLRSRGR